VGEARDRRYHQAAGWLSLPLPLSVYLGYSIALVSAGACWIGGVWQRQIDFRLSTILSSVIVLNLIVIDYLNFTQAQPLP
jgi:hypothetical protein